MASESCFDALGFSFSVGCEDSVLGALLDEVLGPLATDGSVAHRYVVRQTDDAGPELSYELRFDDQRVSGSSAMWGMVDSVVHDLNRRVVDASPHLLLHAGGVAGGGVGVALPGEMESGKTTLTTGLVRAGLGYLTDEALAFDRDTLLVHPYPKPLSIDSGAWPLFPELAPPDPIEEGYDYVQWQVPATAIRPGAVADVCSVVAVVFPRYEAGAETAMSPVGRGEALVELAKNTFRFKERGAAELDLLAELVRGVECYRLTMGEIDRAVGLVAGLLDVSPSRESVP